jgi:hypothetical protein
MWKPILSVLTAMMAVTASAGDAPLGTIVYGRAEPIGPPSEPRYAHLSFEFEHCGALVRTRWFDANHELLAFDELQYPESRLARYRLWRPNIGQWTDMKRAGSTLLIERHDHQAVESVRLTVAEDISAGPMLVLDAVRSRQQIEAGNPLQVSYAVPEQMAAFDLSLARMNAPAGVGAAVAVTASSWLIRPFMHPVEIYFDAAGEITRMRGRVLPATGTAEHPLPMEADTRVERSESRNCSTQPLEELTLP